MNSKNTKSAQNHTARFQQLLCRVHLHAFLVQNPAKKMKGNNLPVTYNSTTLNFGYWRALKQFRQASKTNLG